MIFPFFLHPDTREEYALARTERKSAAGYYGFTCDFNPQVTLEEDLMRRDLTINAMAMDEAGNLFDPYHGQRDLQDKCLRHVSSAFTEDPVRVLRVARFAARYHHLGFSIADETRCLMAEMVRNGELCHLVPERVWQEFYRALQEKNPEQFILVLRQCGALAVVIPELDALFGIPNPPSVCSMVDTGLQAIEALKKVASLSESALLRFAALWHDIGHICTPMVNWPTHQSTPAETRAIVEVMCKRLRAPKEYMHLTLMTAQYYSTLQNFKQLDAETIVTMLEQCDAFRRAELFKQVLWIADAIALHPSQQQAKNWLNILALCGKINAQLLISRGSQGEAIKIALHQERVKMVQTLRRKYNEK